METKILKQLYKIINTEITYISDEIDSMFQEFLTKGNRPPRWGGGCKRARGGIFQIHLTSLSISERNALPPACINSAGT
jgi:hypothetical protein